MTTFQIPPGYEVDLGNLAAFDKRVGIEGTPVEVATQGVEPLVHAIFSLPVLESDEAKLVSLPNGAFHLPRAKPIPKERALTKWEKFAKEKGIQKRHRDRLVLDDATGEYVPRYGKGSKNALDRDVILPHKESMGEDYDPFAQKRKEKKQRIKENTKKHNSNLGRAAKGRRAQINPVHALDVGKAGPSGKKFLPKKGLKDSLAIAQRSTASAGRFDQKVTNEPKAKLQGRKKKFQTIVDKKALGKEKERSQKIAERILMGRK
ncbi:ribosome biogenesis regulatory protein (RRS1) family protein [Chondrus crispus]|uniref:Ribosome biogenesis regulatory protein n=1 Tax=Chondrus crispus TaxID=2769 RepID=R7QJH4_CHOCR|nr:ribosome biogenesis regulatory protein (RRS1) family protein [Chondrus crispus]CDF38667.1 ribosome biogenesis regulatory protein (RRS1) family protein [Chondrus crispus]|eukprot:XP_005718572.1 ribosome biogenesis regulatory protein (RRS1) family protein [Chondrus crispus]